MAPKKRRGAVKEQGGSLASGSSQEGGNVQRPTGAPERERVGPSTQQEAPRAAFPDTPTGSVPRAPRPYAPPLGPRPAAASSPASAIRPIVLPHGHYAPGAQVQAPTMVESAGPRPALRPPTLFNMPRELLPAPIAVEAALTRPAVRPPPGYNAARGRGRGQAQMPVEPALARPAMRPPPGYNAPRGRGQAQTPSTPARTGRPVVRPAYNRERPESETAMLPSRQSQQAAGPSTAVQPTADAMAALKIRERTDKITPVESTTMPKGQPTTGKEISPALRPGFGTLGRGIRLKANHFPAKCSKDTLFLYDVVLSPDTTSKGVRRAVIRELLRVHRSSTLMNILPAFDGSKSLYTARPLPFHSREFIDIIPADEVPAAPAPPGQVVREPRRYKVTLSIVANVDMFRLQEYLEGRTLEIPQTAIQALDIVLREKALQTNVPVGRSFFNEQVSRPVDLSGGLVAWRGYYQSLRPTQGGLTLNLDMSASAFHKPIDVIRYIPEVVRNWRGSTLMDADRIKLGKALGGVRFEVTHRGEMRRRYRIMGITRRSARDSRFLYDGQEISVADYFEQVYHYKLKYPGLQCFEVGARKDVLMPMEVCRIVGGQRYPRKLNDQQVRALLGIVKQSPKERKQLTEEMVARNNYAADEYAQEFGLTISKDMADVPGRVLNAPTLVYKQKNHKDITQQPREGSWNMIRTCLYSGVNIDRWAVLTFLPQRMEGAVANFASNLARQCNDMGMHMNARTMLPIGEWMVGDETYYNGAHMTSALKAITSRSHELHAQGLQLLVCIFPEVKSQPYGTLKRVCETEIGLVTQCCLAKHVQANKPQYLANLALKINVKVQPGENDAPAYNTLLSKEVQEKLPFINEDKVPTIIFGADVTHPQPGERDETASIAAIVASQNWPYVNRYEALVSAQPGTEEIIQNARGMFKQHLIGFYKKTGQKPQRIIMYRDGVSEGQFYQVLWHELNALWKACEEDLEAGYKPKVTWIVCQKRHHTRLFCADPTQADRSGNVPAGTVVDRVITHPSQFDFYLNSHAGLLGTSRPCHYHVLYDQNSFTADAIQDLTNSLCYTYARCTRSVSLAPPAYYAHLAAFRARFYMDSADSDRGSTSSGSSGRREAGRPAYYLPPIKDALVGTMFFC